MECRVAIVTGASEGIGLAGAKLLAARGATVAICARNQDRPAAGLAELQAAGKGEAHVLDVSDPNAVSFITALGVSIKSLDGSML